LSEKSWYLIYYTILTNNFDLVIHKSNIFEALPDYIDIAITMSFKILYVAATRTESDLLGRINGMTLTEQGYAFGNIIINVLVTGVGSVSTAWSMQKWLSENGIPDLAINGGIAGSYNDGILIGDVVMPVTDCFADSGIEDNDNFLTLSEAGLMKEDEFPFKSGSLQADNQYIDLLKPAMRAVSAITVNTATGSETTRIRLLKKFNPDIETMEGATFFYICIREKIPFLALRAISNRVEPRNRNNWRIQTALDNLSEKIKEVIIRLE
jgi:futalosine hydrolase